MLLEQHGGQVPADRASLIALPGVGRKIANLILGDCFGIPAVVVDTHCLRISKLIGFTENTDPLKVEHDLIAILPESEWTAYGHLVVTHGREICIARRPQCGRCPVMPCCRYGSGLDPAALAGTTGDEAAAADSERPTARPADRKPTARPAARKPTARPAARKPAARPAARKPAAGSTGGSAPHA